MPTLTLEGGLKVGVPEGTGAYLRRLLEHLAESLELDAPGTAYRQLQQCFRCLIDVNAGLANSACQILGGVSFQEELLPVVETVGVLTQALQFLGSEAHHRREIARQILLVFFEDDGETPLEHTRLLGVAGRAPARIRKLHDFCTWVPDPKEHLGRDHFVHELRRYLPYLDSWLKAMGAFWERCPRTAEVIGLDGCYAAAYTVGGLALAARAQVELDELIPARQLLLPTGPAQRVGALYLPRKAPEQVVVLFERLTEAVGNQDVVASCLQLRNLTDLLIRYFAGVAFLVRKDLDGSDESSARLARQSVFISCCEDLLRFSIEALMRQPESLAAKELVSVFYTRNELFEFIPRGHTEILLLEGVLSAWCQLEPGTGELSEPELCRRDFERYLPVVRDWLASMGRYLTETEHFFEPVRGGRVEVSVRVGDRFVNLASPDYTLWLDPPRQLLPEEQVGGGRPLRIPAGCPDVLRSILRRLNVFVHQDDPVEACVSLRDALDYLTRYSAGVAAAAFRELDTLPDEAEEMARNSPSIRECEKLLILSLKSIGQGEEEDLGQAVRSIFFNRSEFFEEDRPTGSHARMLQTDADPNNKHQLLAEFCSSDPADGAVCRREIRRFLPVLRDWLTHVESFFEACEHFEEPPAEDGSMELVVQFADHYLELVEPDYTFVVRPGCNEVPDVEVPEPEPEAPAKAPEPLGDEGEEPRKAGEPFVMHRVDYIGQQKNSQGRMCLSGFIRITNGGGGTLSGTATSTHPSVEVSPTRFRGNKAQLTYWADEDSLPQNFQAFIVLKTSEDERQIPVWEMRPRSVWGTLPLEEARRALLVPCLAALFIFSLVFFPSVAYIQGVLTEAAGPAWANTFLAKEARGALIQVLPVTQVIGWLFLLMPGLVPLGVAKIFKRLSPTVQEQLENQRSLAMFSISIAVFVLLALPVFRTPVTTETELAACNMYQLFFPWFVSLNALVSAYLMMSLNEKLDDWFHDPMVRNAVPAVLGFGYVCLLMLALA